MFILYCKHFCCCWGGIRTGLVVWGGLRVGLGVRDGVSVILIYNSVIINAITDISYRCIYMQIFKQIYKHNVKTCVYTISA